MKRLTAAEERARREGWADAVVLLAMCDPRPTTAEDLAAQLRRGLDPLGIDQLGEPEIRAALRRWRARRATADGAGPTDVARILDGRTERPRLAKAGAHAGPTCPECGRVCKGTSGLRKHQTLAHRMPEVSCPRCGRVTTPQGLGPHRRHCKGPSS